MTPDFLGLILKDNWKQADLWYWNQAANFNCNITNLAEELNHIYKNKNRAQLETGLYITPKALLSLVWTMYHSRASREQKTQTKPKKLTLSGFPLKAKHSSMLNNYCQIWICKCSEFGWASVFLPAISQWGNGPCCQLYPHRKPDAGCSHLTA